MKGRLIVTIGDFKVNHTGYVIANDLKEKDNQLSPIRRENDFVPDFFFKPEGTRQLIGVTRREVQILA